MNCRAGSRILRKGGGAKPLEKIASGKGVKPQWGAWGSSHRKIFLATEEIAVPFFHVKFWSLKIINLPKIGERTSPTPPMDPALNCLFKHTKCLM